MAYKLTDGFCGAGGSSQGAAAVDNVERERAARGWVLDDLTPAMAADGWLYAASHPTESDTLQVVERKVTR